MCVFCEVPSVVKNAGMFCVVALWLLCDAYGLGKETRVVGEVEGAGQETALLEDVGDVAERACVAGIDMDHFWCGGSRTCRWRWETASCFLHKAGDGDAMVLINVMGVGSVVPFDVSELSEV